MLSTKEVPYARETRTALARVRALRRHDKKTACRTARSLSSTAEGTQGKTRHARTKAEGQALRFRRSPRLASGLDRFLSNSDNFRLRRSLPGELVPDQPLADDTGDRGAEAISVSHGSAVFVPPVAIPKRLLIDVPEQVERVHTHIGTVQAVLQQEPEILHSVGIDVSANVLLGAIDDPVDVVFIKSPLGDDFVSEDFSAGRDVSADAAAKSFFVPVLDNPNMNLPSALKHSHRNRLASNATALDPFFALVLEHVTRVATDEGFVNVCFAAKQPVIRLKTKADALQHEPGGLLGYPQNTGNLVGANTVLAARKKPDRGKPLTKTERRIFKDSPDLDGELPLGMLDRALPYLPVSDVTRILATAGRAYYNTIWPAPRNQVSQAIIGIGEVDDCPFESGWLGCHASRITEKQG